MQHMVKTNAQRQAEYQRRQSEAGSYRLDAYISADAHAALEQVVQREGCTRKDAIEQSLFNAAKGLTMQSQFRKDDPATDVGGARYDNKQKLGTITLYPDAPARKTVSPTNHQRKEVPAMTTKQPARMTKDEAADLEKFKTKLLNDKLDAREHKFDGGDDGARRKAAFNAALDASNEHRK